MIFWPRALPTPFLGLLPWDVSGFQIVAACVVLNGDLSFLLPESIGASKIEVFVFGTRLTRITRELKKKSVDDAITQVASRVEDWSGGTRWAISPAPSMG